MMGRRALKAAIIARGLDAVPGLADIGFRRLTDQSIDLREMADGHVVRADHARENVAGTFRVCGTCLMGPAEDPDTVVETSARVHGIDDLWVFDSSIMPRIPRDNINIPTITLAEKNRRGDARGT